MALFDDIDPLDQNKILPTVPRELLMKKLLLVSSKSLRERQWIFPGDTLAELQENKVTYIILMPTIVPLKRKWKKLSMGSLNRQQMQYINKKLKEYAVEAIEAQDKLIKQFTSTLGNIVNRDDDDNENDNNSSSSSPTVRTDFMNNIGLNKNHRIKKWLNDIVIDNGDDELISDDLHPTTSSNINENDVLLDDQSIFQLFDEIGRDLLTDHLDGFEYVENPSLTSINLKENQSIPLTVPKEYSTRFGKTTRG